EPHAPNAWAALAAAELADGDGAAARRDATRAIALLQDYPFAIHVRARASTLEGDRAAADGDLQRLRALAAGAADDDTARAARSICAEADCGK
ncbi:MAG: hypothetical protein M3O36_15710, partial [Myxococcota bacterium]|nr:hypothetical protein [Myxococcota bacterium]